MPIDTTLGTSVTIFLFFFLSLSLTFLLFYLPFSLYIFLMVPFVFVLEGFFVCLNFV